MCCFGVELFICITHVDSTSRPPDVEQILKKIGDEALPKWQDLFSPYARESRWRRSVIAWIKIEGNPTPSPSIIAHPIGSDYLVTAQAVAGCQTICYPKSPVTLGTYHKEYTHALQSRS